MALNPEFQSMLLEVYKALHAKTQFKRMPYTAVDRGWSMHFRNNRVYILDKDGNDMTAAVMLAGEDYETAARYIDDEKMKQGVLLTGELVKLREKQAELLKEMMMAFAQKDRKVVDRSELKHAYVKSSELKSVWGVEKNLEDK